MAIQLSPGVNVSEIDLTTVVPSVATTDGAFAGVFRWGPIGERVFIDTEDRLVARFGKPTNFNPETFFSAANFLSYANRLWVSRAANTSGATPYIPACVTTGKSNVVSIPDTTLIEPGMYLTQTSNTSIFVGNEKTYVVSKNSTSIVMSTAALEDGIVDLYFGRPETTYTAIGFDSANADARVANLVHQIVSNENDYLVKDGTFDSDIIYVAKYPGKLGNSIRVGVCDNPASFTGTISTIDNTAPVNSMMEFRIGDKNAYLKYAGTNGAFAAEFAGQISVGDQIRAGNAAIGYQYLQVLGTKISFDDTSFAVVNGNTGIKDNFFTISNNSFTNGDAVVYSNTSTTAVVQGLTPDTTYYVVHANTSGIKLAEKPFGDIVSVLPTSNAVAQFNSNTTTLAVTFEDPYRLRSPYTTTNVNRNWEFFNVFETAPGQSTWQLTNGNTAALDELHLVVVDDGGLITGTPGTILESYKGLSRAVDAKNVDGSGNYYKDVLNQGSQFIWWANDRSVAPSAKGQALTTSTAAAPADIKMVLGSDGLDENAVSLGTLGQAWDLFASPEDIDVSLIIQGKPVGGVTVVNGETVVNYQLANYLINNIAERRKDCIVLISPDKSTVLNNIGDEANSLKNWRGALVSTSYAVMDSGYKYQYDRYNDLYRWVPLNADIAGTCVRTDQTNDAWWSPAGYNRGGIKNVIKLAYNPNKAARDILYPNGVNPVVTQPGQGTVLFGDKTLQSKPSAFDRINVRRLFIVLEKAISTAAKYSLFEFNDTFTRAQFKNLIVPYLRTVQGRRGITEFKVVCDESNNPPQIVDSNQFVGDIYIKPARSINFIQLNFVAVPSGVQFSEVIGKF